MKNLYITDLDHTFLRSDHSISDFTREVWNAKSADSILTIATARSFNQSMKFLKGLNLYAPLVLLDGAMIVSAEKKLIDMKTLDKNMGDAIVEIGLRFGIEPFIIGVRDMGLDEKFLYPQNLNPHQEFVLGGYKSDSRMEFNPANKTLDMNLKIVYFGEYSQLKPLAQEIYKILGSRIEIKLSPEKYSDGYFLTLLHSKGDKAYAIETLMQHLDIEENHITVFGDSINDISMFKLANTSVAVSNALDEVKAVANIILPYSNDEDGVAKYLEGC